MTSSNTGANSLVSIARNGDYAVRVHGKDAIIHAAVPIEGSHAIQFLKVKEGLSSQIKFVRFFNSLSPDVDDEDSLDLVPHTQVVFGSESCASVWRTSELLAEVENIEPAVVNCDFGATEDELLVFHAWNTKLTVFNLENGQSFVIKSPKFSHPHGYGYRHKTKQLAILLKVDTNDILTIHGTRIYEVIAKVVLPTVDAQGLKWSSDGRWIAVWEAASTGTKVLVLAGNGQLYRTYTGIPTSDNTHDLGIRSLEWAPLSTEKVCRLLAIGKCDGTIDILNTRTFSCFATITHPVHLDEGTSTIWRERQSENDGLEYIEVPGSSVFAALADLPSIPRGVSTMQFSSDGSFLATLDQSRPNVLWIWSVRDNPVLHTALVHENNIRQFAWHRAEAKLLITTNQIALPSVHLWHEGSAPIIARVPLGQNDGRYEITWTGSYSDGNALFWLSTLDSCVLGSISTYDGQGQFNLLHSLT